MNKLVACLAMVLSVIAIFLAARGQTFSHVDADGTALRMLIAGEGNPTVVFEAGAHSPLEAWVRVQPEVSRFARTVSYDRAGNGLSKKSAAPRDGRHIARELHTALHNAQVPPPYLLVGHSLGGPYMRIFAGLYPDEVAGLVLVDPTQEELLAWAEARDPKREDGHKSRPDNEVDCAPATFAEARRNPVPVDLPVFLICGQGPRVVPGFLTKEFKAEVQKDRETYAPAKLKFHREWVERFPGGRLIVTENSGHGIPFEEPGLVIATIRQAIEQVKAREASKR